MKCAKMIWAEDKQCEPFVDDDDDDDDDNDVADDDNNKMMSKTITMQLSNRKIVFCNQTCRYQYQ